MTFHFMHLVTHQGLVILLVWIWSFVAAGCYQGKWKYPAAILCAAFASFGILAG